MRMRLDIGRDRGQATYIARARASADGVLRGPPGINRAFTRYPVNLIKAIANPSSLPGSNDLRD